jgi:hypothetical protein
VDYSRNFLTLSWKPSDSSGGIPTHYVLERREDGKQTWTPIKEVEPSSVDAKELTARVFDLKGGRSYHFRVRATNAFGSSEPITTEEPHMFMGKS